jgi:hypothetical protein
MNKIQIITADTKKNLSLILNKHANDDLTIDVRKIFINMLRKSGAK